MALSDKKIIEERKNGSIIIEPFRKENLSTSSYDVTLGEWYFRERKPAYHRNIYNLYDKAHTDAVWGTQAHRAEKAKEVLGHTISDYVGIGPNDRIIMLEPGETILAHTEEFIGGKNHITTMMKARSTLGRNFIEVCKCAGWGDVGYINRWTMEITNNSRHYTIPLVTGRRIAQMVFFETGPILEKDYTEKGKYQTNATLVELKKTWVPTMMLPKLYADRDIDSKKHCRHNRGAYK
jgi:dCTP deaminase